MHTKIIIYMIYVLCAKHTALKSEKSSIWVSHNDCLKRHSGPEKLKKVQAKKTREIK